MKNFLVLTVLALAVAGCRKEAERFGYTGVDLEDDDLQFFSTGPSVTNWVPARVLAVCERYAFTTDEIALVEAVGVVPSGEELTEIPAGYVKRDAEPWFETWVRNVENFGMRGVVGFVSHFDEDRGVWQVGETFFSSYSESETLAKGNLAALEREISARYNPLKIYRFDNCFVAEYRRLRVMALVGQKADGVWGCMLSFQDKNRAGCGPWEPVSAQEERVETVRRARELKAWRAAKAEAVQRNHAKVEELRKAKGIALFEGAGVNWFESDEGRYMCWMNGQFETNAVTAAEFFSNKVAEVGMAVGAPFDGEPTVQETEEGVVFRGAYWKTDLYEVRVDVASPPGQWRTLCAEVIQPGCEIPPRP